MIVTMSIFSFGSDGCLEEMERPATNFWKLLVTDLGVETGFLIEGLVTFSRTSCTGVSFFLPVFLTLFEAGGEDVPQHSWSFLSNALGVQK